MGSIPAAGSGMTVYTYLIKSEKDGSFYAGITEDPYIRTDVHNRGGVKSSSNKRPYKLVYFKPHEDYQSARKHEKWLKKKSKEYKNKLADIAQLAPPKKAG